MKKSFASITYRRRFVYKKLFIVVAMYHKEKKNQSKNAQYLHIFGNLQKFKYLISIKNSNYFINDSIYLIKY